MTEKQKQERWDFVDNSIFELIKKISPSKVELKWDIEAITEIRHAIEYYLIQELKLCTEDEFYPYSNDE